MIAAPDDREWAQAVERDEQRRAAEQARKCGHRLDNVKHLPLRKPVAQDSPDPTKAETPAPEPSGDKKKAKPLYAGVLEARVEPGRYIGVFAGYRVTKAWARTTWMCAFKIVDFPWIDDAKSADRQRRVDELRRQHARFLGVHVPRFVNMPENTGIRSVRSNFAKDWQSITGRRAPKNLARFTPPHLYSLCTIELEVRDVMHDSDQRSLHVDDVYSVVSKVIRLCDGSPPCMREKGG